MAKRGGEIARGVGGVGGVGVLARVRGGAPRRRRRRSPRDPGGPREEGEEGAAGGGGGGDGGTGDASDASDDGLDDDSDVPLGAHTNASSSSSGGSPFTTSSARRRETLEDVLDQLRDVEPKFDFELSVIVRPIATTLFAGVAARSWNHAALRLAPDEVTPFAYSDPLALAAVDLLPEVAVAYAESLRAGNATEEEIKRKLGDAVNVRFVVTVALITRQQISVGGGTYSETSSR